MANTKPMAKAVAISSILGAMGIAIPFNAMAADSLEGALKESTTKLNLRPRYENVEAVTAAGDESRSEAATLRTRLTFTTGSFYDFSAVLEFDDVTSLKDVDYFDGVNSKDGPIIPDPEGTEVNQAYLAYSGLADTKFIWGRQRILLDNQRFVGGVGWRQNEQTYDAFSIANSSIPGLSAFYANISNVNRIFGEQATPDVVPAARLGDHTEETNLLNVGYTIDGIGKISAYYYDIDNLDAVGLSNTSMGVRFAGATEMDAIKLDYELEWAEQEETGDNPTEYTADYTLISLSGTMSGFTLGLAQETLGADDDAGVGFTTSLATLHKFQGWADVFLATPGTGVEDMYVTFKAGLPMGMSFIAMYHEFESAEDVAAGTSSDFGSEIDMALSKKFSNGATLLLKYADFSGGDDYFTTDVTKVWVMAEYAI
ncbi:MAG: alginate export family protein [Pseudomonadota bacterium]|nr:alginate export family protein [Pseudomonadota bacterium]